jgi:SAM-dependent methyltransferase
MLPPLTLSGWLRYDVIRRLLRSLPIKSILEIGPGVGALGVRLATAYEYVGVELDEESARLARERLTAAGAGRIVHGTPADLDERFDLVCAFEVLEHITDDEAALELWAERVEPGRWLALSVPAGVDRWGAHDEHAGHIRRYEREQLHELLQSAGLSGARIDCYGFPVLSAIHPIWNALSARATLAPTLEARTRASGRFRQPPAWLGAAIRLAALPLAVAQRPFLSTNLGTGYVVLAQRRT